MALKIWILYAFQRLDLSHHLPVFFAILRGKHTSIFVVHTILYALRT